MNIRNCAALLIAAMMLMISGCGFQAAEEPLDTVEDLVERPVEIAEEAAETAIREILLPGPEPVSQEKGTQAAKSSSAAGPSTDATEPTASALSPVLTKEYAESIALKHAGFTKNQVSDLHTEYDIDDRVPEYDVEFREGRWEYEYEIHAETGAILSFEKDD